MTTQRSPNGVMGANYSFSPKTASQTPVCLTLSIEHLNKITLTIEKVSQ